MKFMLLFILLCRFRYHQDQNGSSGVGHSAVLSPMTSSVYLFSLEMRGYRARDDPSFLLLLCVFMSGKDYALAKKPQPALPLCSTVVSAIGYGLWLQLPVTGVICGWLWTVMVDCLATAVFVAVVMW